MNIAELERSLEAARRMRWTPPPADVRRATRRVPGGSPLPRLAADACTFARPSDVRATTVLGEQETVFVSHSSEHADVSLALTETGGLLQVEGRIWRSESLDPDDEIQIAWVHGEHVLDRLGVRDGEMFRFEGAPLHGWTLEVALPGHRALVIEDPAA